MKGILEKHPSSMEYLLDMLHDVQAADSQNHLSREALREVSEYVGAPLSTVVSSASFYSMFSLTPRGRHVIRVCESPPCQLMGAESLLQSLADILGVGVGETTDDGAFTIETSSCLGICGVAPAMMIDEDLYGKLTRERVVEILQQVRRDDAEH